MDIVVNVNMLLVFWMFAFFSSWNIAFQFVYWNDELASRLHNFQKKKIIKLKTSGNEIYSKSIFCSDSIK